MTAERLCQFVKGQGKGGQKGKGAFPWNCNHCGKPGHKKQECKILDAELAAKRAKGFGKAGQGGKGQPKGTSWGKGSSSYKGSSWGRPNGAYGVFDENWEASELRVPEDHREEANQICALLLEKAAPIIPQPTVSFYSNNRFALL